VTPAKSGNAAPKHRPAGAAAAGAPWLPDCRRRRTRGCRSSRRRSTAAAGAR
jgi:hypothetical protein